MIWQCLLHQLADLDFERLGKGQLIVHTFCIQRNKWHFAFRHFRHFRGNFRSCCHLFAVCLWHPQKIALSSKALPPLRPRFARLSCMHD